MWGWVMSGFRRFVGNALVLVGAALLMRSVSLLFSAYVSRTVGAEGMGLFALAMSVYGFAVTVATSGISLAVTRLCAAALGENDAPRLRAVLRRAVVYALFFGGVASLTLLLFAAPIGTDLLRDARTVPSLRLLGCSLVPIALSSVFSGYFSAVRRVVRSAMTQMFEQAVRIFLTVLGLLAFAPKGIEYACLALVGGSALAEFCSFFFLLCEYLIDRRRHFRGVRVAAAPGLFSELLRAALPVAVSAYVRSGLVTVEHILIPICLLAAGGSRADALASYGVLHSMAIPFILYPTAVSSVFAGLLVPEMAECHAAGKEARIRYMTTRALRYTLLFSVLCAGVLGALSDEIGMLFYASREAGVYIRYLAPVVVIMYLDTTVDCILKGLGYQVYCMGVNIADSLLSVLLVAVLLPRTGAIGYVAVITISELVNFSLSITRLHRVVGFPFPLYRFLIAPLLAVVGATSLVRLVLPYAGDFLGFALQLLFLLLLYALLLWLLGAVPRKERTWLSTLFSNSCATSLTNRKQCGKIG